uniref:Uncharacterized protein n=1 Tax=Arundo donax TaxID=35708 RepID=A0A0A9DIU3_ARUDO
MYSRDHKLQWRSIKKECISQKLNATIKSYNLKQSTITRKVVFLLQHADPSTWKNMDTLLQMNFLYLAFQWSDADSEQC